MERINIPELAPVGAYSSVVKVDQELGGEWYYISGVIGIDYKEGSLKASSFEEEATQVMTHTQTILQHLKLDFTNIVKATVYLTDLTQFGALNEIYGKYFPEKEYPAREVVEVRRLPKNVNIEISYVAYKKFSLEDVTEKTKEEVSEKIEKAKKFFSSFFKGDKDKSEE